MTHVTPEDPEQEELEVYAEEYTVLKDVEDLDGFHWSLTTSTGSSMFTKSVHLLIQTRRT